MREALLASLAAALLAPVIRALVWRVPMRFLGAVGVRAALGAALVAFVGAGLAAGLLPAPVAGTVGFALATVLTLIAARRRRGPRGLATLALRLADPGAATTARALLLRRAQRTSPKASPSVFTCRPPAPKRAPKPCWPTRRPGKGPRRSARRCSRSWLNSG